MTQTAKASEPSMEEILASIRRIIADDEPAKPAPRPAPAPAPAAEEAPKSQDDIDALLAGFDEIAEEPAAPPPPPARPEPEILELSTTDAVPDHIGIIKPIAQRADIDFMDAPMPAPAPAPAPVPVARAPVAEAPALLSPETHAAVGAAFGSLANTMFSGGSKTIDDVVKEMLRPMLKTWLDDNLPQLVERLVRAEIERVSRGGSGR